MHSLPSEKDTKTLIQQGFIGLLRSVEEEPPTLQAHSAQLHCKPVISSDQRHRLFYLRQASQTLLMQAHVSHREQAKENCAWDIRYALCHNLE
jgi:hypothetical protein